ncbi:unnamed protein product [Owenia fusiformis]|uniref:Chitin-binding type-2 domain-containing protein n=1 Tax=Owenia fusiformis TaxID=6347 RepID=A0A8S4PAW1_OWEFU|nr:unnamed protein product [Owenia fusiformis]
MKRTRTMFKIKFTTSPCVWITIYILLESLSGSLSAKSVPDPDFKCPQIFGLFADPLSKDCCNYYKCKKGIPKHKRCPYNMVFKEGRCRWRVEGDTECKPMEDEMPKRCSKFAARTGKINVDYGCEYQRCVKHENRLVWKTFDYLVSRDCCAQVQAKEKRPHLCEALLIKTNEEWLEEMGLSEYKCPKRRGVFQATTRCKRYIRCINYKPEVIICPTGLLYYKWKRYCDWPENVPTSLCPDRDGQLTTVGITTPSGAPTTNASTETTTAATTTSDEITNNTLETSNVTTAEYTSPLTDRSTAMTEEIPHPTPASDSSNISITTTVPSDITSNRTEATSDETTVGVTTQSTEIPKSTSESIKQSTETYNVTIASLNSTIDSVTGINSTVTPSTEILNTTIEVKTYPSETMTESTEITSETTTKSIEKFNNTQFPETTYIRTTNTPITQGTLFVNSTSVITELSSISTLPLNDTTTSRTAETSPAVPEVGEGATCDKKDLFRTHTKGCLKYICKIVNDFSNAWTLNSCVVNNTCCIRADCAGFPNCALFLQEQSDAL